VGVLAVLSVSHWSVTEALDDSVVFIDGMRPTESIDIGMGSLGQMLYMMQQIAPGPFKMTHYAFATGVMAMTKWATGSVSGWVYAAFDHHYAPYFAFVLAASIPPLLLAWFAPFPHDERSAHGEPDGVAA